MVDSTQSGWDPVPVRVLPAVLLPSSVLLLLLLLLLAKAAAACDVRAGFQKPVLLFKTGIVAQKMTFVFLDLET